jgi:uncharacterized protein YgiM (DUF1202 family)
MKSRNFYFAVIAAAFVFTGCGSETEPVSAEPTQIIESTEEVETESEEVGEKSEPEAEPTKEPVLASPVEEESDIEESEDNNSELGYTIESVEEILMYCMVNSANIRKGPNTSYDKVGTLSYAQEIVVNGKVETADSTWYIIKTDDNDIQMVSGSLLSTTKPQPKQTFTPSGGNTSQPSGDGNNNQPSNGSQSSNDDPGSVEMGEAGGAFSDLPESGAGGIDYNAPELHFE